MNDLDAIYSELSKISAGLSDLARRVRSLEIASRDEFIEDYWTPYFAGSSVAGSFTYAIQYGKYFFSKKIVIASCRIAISAIITPPTGYMNILGLPIPCSSDTHSMQCVTIGYSNDINYPTNGIQLTGYIGSATSNIILVFAADNAPTIFYAASDFTNPSAALMVSAVYAR